MRSFQEIHQRLKNLGASALVIVLLGITIVTVLTLTLFLVSRYERKSANLALGKATSESLADLAADLAILRLKEATDDGLSPGKMWVSEPGRIRVYTRKNLTEYVDYDLFSKLPGPDTSLRDQNSVDLNERSFDGKYPIANPAPGNSRATMKIGWINMPANPGEAASSTNPIAGRIAYWIDDESCKVNINTADGSKKYTQESYGFGTPSEISLQALAGQDGVNLTQAQASDIASYAWNTGFNSAGEVGRVPGIADGFYEPNKFNLTYYSKAPELTFYGEPRMYLMPTAALSNVTYCVMTGPSFPQGTPSVEKLATPSLMGERVDFVYPTSKQLPTGAPGIYDYSNTHTYLADNLLPQYSLGRNGQIFNRPQSNVNNRALNFPFAYRIVQALNGLDSKDASFDWPAFGAPGASPATKYNVRQRDSIALQILDLSNSAVFSDHARTYSLPSISSGIHGNAINPAARMELVCGLGRSPKLTEVSFSADVGVGDPLGKGATVPFIQPRITLEFYLPKYYLGTPLDAPYASTDVSQWRTGNKSIITKTYIDPIKNEETSFNASTLNELDIGLTGPKQVTADPAVYSRGDASPLDSSNYWMNSMLHINGVDLAGNPAYTDFKIKLPGPPEKEVPQSMEDPSQPEALAYHSPYAYSTLDGFNKYQGVFTARTATRFPLLQMPGPTLPTMSWPPGAYHAQDHGGNGLIPYFGAIGSSGFTVSGGIAFRSHASTGEYGSNWEFTPMDGLRSEFYTNETPSAIKSEILGAVIPIHFDAPENYIARVADPLVNKFPGDWIIDEGGANPTFVMPSAANFNPSSYARGGDTNDPAFPVTATIVPTNFDGDNPEFLPTGGGDPLSLWMPRQDVRYTKQSRFPSIGALNYIRTGMIPDDLSKSLNEQKGVPFRSINLSAESTSQGVYPDWAMLDLFTVPFIPQPVYFSGQTATPKRRLTYGGATEGKLNINNPRVPFPFSQTISGVDQIPPVRTSPLEALFYGIKTSKTYSANEPVYTTVSQTEAAALRQAVQDHLATKGPFLLPGQLSEVAAVNAYTYGSVAANAKSRNDLMRETIGAITTQSNVFSVWIVAQTVKKAARNSNPGIFEPGDSIVGETRRRYIIERQIDYGKDGVPGNASNPGPDGIVGTEDDPIDANYHPAMTYPLPYKWRIIAMESYGA